MIVQTRWRKGRLVCQRPSIPNSQKAFFPRTGTSLTGTLVPRCILHTRVKARMISTSAYSVRGWGTLKIKLSWYECRPCVAGPSVSCLPCSGDFLRRTAGGRFLGRAFIAATYRCFRSRLPFIFVSARSPDGLLGHRAFPPTF